MDIYSPYYYKRKSKKKKAYFKVILLISLALVITFILAQLYILVLSPQKKCSLPYNFYFISVGEYDNYTSASVYAKKCRDKGGAGYIFKDKKYHVFASVYLSESDAQKIEKSLKLSGENAKIITMELNPIISKDKNITQCISKLDLLIVESYNLCNNSEIGLFDGVILESEVARIKSNLDACKDISFNDTFRNILTKSGELLDRILQSSNILSKDLRYYNCELCAQLYTLIFS